MPSNNDQSQFIMFTGIGAVGMSAIIAVVYFVAFSNSGSSGDSSPAPDAVASTEPADDATMSTPSAPGDLTPQNTKSNAGNPAGMQNPFLQAQAAADRVRYKNNLKQIVLAAHNYHDTYRSFPVARDALAKNSGLSWRVYLLPYLDETPLFNQFNKDEPWDSAQNKPLADRMPKIFLTPGAAPNHTGVVRFDHEGAFPVGSSQRIASITDGTSNTIFCAVVDGKSAVPWSKPVDYPYDPANPAAGLLDMGGTFLVALCDGSTPSIQTTISTKTLNNLIMRSDGQVIDSF
jgi:hypothetical protein